MENDRQALHLQPVPVLGGPCDLIEVLSVRKFVTQLVRRLPKNSADAVPEAADKNFTTKLSVKNLNKTTLSHSTQARHRCELAQQKNSLSQQTVSTQVRTGAC